MAQQTILACGLPIKLGIASLLSVQRLFTDMKRPYGDDVLSHSLTALCEPCEVRLALHSLRRFDT